MITNFLFILLGFSVLPLLPLLLFKTPNYSYIAIMFVLMSTISIKAAIFRHNNFKYLDNNEISIITMVVASIHFISSLIFLSIYLNNRFDNGTKLVEWLSTVTFGTLGLLATIIFGGILTLFLRKEKKRINSDYKVLSSYKRIYNEMIIIRNTITSFYKMKSYKTELIDLDIKVINKFSADELKIFANDKKMKYTNKKKFLEDISKNINNDIIIQGKVVSISNLVELIDNYIKQDTFFQSSPFLVRKFFHFYFYAIQYLLLKIRKVDRKETLFKKSLLYRKKINIIPIDAEKQYLEENLLDIDSILLELERIITNFKTALKEADTALL